MHTYLFVCGIVFNVLLILLIIFVVIDGIHVRKYNNKKRAEYTRKQAQYKEELVLAKQKWRQWVKKCNELEQNRAKENDPYKQLAFDRKRILLNMEGSYYFASIDKCISLRNLSEENNWVLEE